MTSSKHGKLKTDQPGEAWFTTRAPSTRKLNDPTPPKKNIGQERLEPKTPPIRLTLSECRGLPCPHQSHQPSAETILNVVWHYHIRNRIAEQHSSKHVQESVCSPCICSNVTLAIDINSTNGENTHRLNSFSRICRQTLAVDTRNKPDIPSWLIRQRKRISFD